MKRLCIVTGSRAEWSGLKQIARLAVASPHFETSIVAAGMHWETAYGSTFEEIKRDGYTIDYAVYSSGGPPARSLGYMIQGFVEAFEDGKLDLVLVEGDRVEALAATLAAAYMNIPVAHAGGGDMTETIDNAARHAISHFASLHFVSTEGAAERLRRMEVQGDIHVTGALSIDAIMATQWRTREETLSDLGLPAGSRYLLVGFHPETGHEASANAWMANILHACFETGLHVVATYPNSDPGSSGIINALTDYSPVDSLHAFPSLGSDRYLHALRYADALVGNSSSGLYEAPSLRVPVVNVGHRQDGRLRAFNVQDCGYGYEEIRKALNCDLAMVKVALGRFEADAVAMGVKLLPLNPYGDGKAAERMLAIIEGRLGE